VAAPGGIPQVPYEGIAFSEREPGLTVQNIAQDGIFPDVVPYTKLVPSRVDGKAFLVIQVNESPKAPHAIENSTLVYVRTEGATARTTLADIPRIERMLQRRAEVSRRWDDSFAQSWEFAQLVRVDRKRPFCEVRIGPRFPSEVLTIRESVYDFLSDPKHRSPAGFHLGELFRTPEGALLARDQNVERFLSITNLGTVHYVEPLDTSDYVHRTAQVLEFWRLAVPILKTLRLAGEFISFVQASCELRIEVFLRNVAGESLSSGPNPLNSGPMRTLAPIVPALAEASSEKISQSAVDIVVNLMYQLRWPFGIERAATMIEVRAIVEKMVTHV